MACRVGGARAPGQGDAAIAAAKPRWLPRRAFGATTPPLTETDRQLFFALNARNQHANTDARLSPAPQDIVVVYWRQRHTRLGPPSPSLYGHSGHGLTHDTESYASMALSTVRLGCPSTEVPGNRGGQGWRVAWVVREPRAKATPPSQRRSPGGCPGARSAPPRPL